MFNHAFDGLDLYGESIRSAKMIAPSRGINNIRAWKLLFLDGRPRNVAIHCRNTGPDLSGDVGDGVEIGAALPLGLRAAPSITFFSCRYTLVSRFSGTICPSISPRWY
jgi:hypothetical protein